MQELFRHAGKHLCYHVHKTKTGHLHNGKRPKANAHGGALGSPNYCIKYGLEQDDNQVNH
jgi:hypothetical protein